MNKKAVTAGLAGYCLGSLTILAVWFSWPAGRLPDGKPSDVTQGVAVNGGTTVIDVGGIDVGNGKSVRFNNAWLKGVGSPSPGEVLQRLTERSITRMRHYASLSADGKREQLDKDIDSLRRVSKMMAASTTEPITLATNVENVGGSSTRPVPSRMTELFSSGSPSAPSAVNVQSIPGGQLVTIQVSSTQPTSMPTYPQDVLDTMTQYDKDIRARARERGIPESEIQGTPMTGTVP